MNINGVEVENVPNRPDMKVLSYRGETTTIAHRHDKWSISTVVDGTLMTASAPSISSCSHLFRVLIDTIRGTEEDSKINKLAIVAGKVFQWLSGRWVEPIWALMITLFLTMFIQPVSQIEIVLLYGVVTLLIRDKVYLK